MEDEHPLLWSSSSGAVDDVEPIGFVDKMKWQLLRRWFAPDKTINKRLYSTLLPDGDSADLGAWASVKRYLLRRWLPAIRFRPRTDDPISLAEIGGDQGISTSAPASLHHESGTINELAKMSTPVAMADAEPTAVQQISTLGLRPLSLQERRPSSSAGGPTPRHSEERPGSRGSSGIMIEERNLSDSESDAGEGAGTSSSQERSRRRSDDGRRGSR